MKLNRIVGILVSLVILSVSALVVSVPWLYLTEYGDSRYFFSIFAAIVGAGIAVVTYRLGSKYCKTGKSSILVVVLSVVFVLAPLISMFTPGQITYSRFGLTVYGIIPVPVLDITIGSRGGLWFRDKSHQISLREIQPLLSPDVDILVIGTGWSNVVNVDPNIRNIEGLEVHILPTPAAFDLFNKFKAEGRVVVLIAHSTC